MSVDFEWSVVDLPSTPYYIGIINRQSTLSGTLTVSLCLSVVVVLKATLDGWPIVRAASLDTVEAKPVEPLAAEVPEDTLDTFDSAKLLLRRSISLELAV